MSLILGVLLGALLSAIVPAAEYVRRKRAHRAEMKRLEWWYRAQLNAIKQRGDLLEAAYSRG